MADFRLVDQDVINLVGALWALLTRGPSPDLQDTGGGQVQLPGQKELVELVQGRRISIAEKALCADHHQGGETNGVAKSEEMSIANFIEQRFVPEYVALKRSSSRAFYRSILKHILRPEEVDRLFSFRRNASSERLKAVPGWPYLSNVKLRDVHPDDVGRLTSAASARGYSLHTVRHIRNVVSAIFSYAGQIRCYLGDNPASPIRTPDIHRKRAFMLNLTQAKEALGEMQYPEKEITLLSVFADMSLVEVLGLQWKHVNLSETEVNIDGRRIGPRTIAIRNQLYRGKLEAIAKGRVRNRSISEPLLKILIRLRDRQCFTRPNDFVLVSQVGTPVNQNNILARRLRPIARQLGLPSVSSRAFRSVRKTLMSEYVERLQESLSDEAASVPMRATTVRPNWNLHRPEDSNYIGNQAELAHGPI